jgi:hypothetical protein
MSLISTGSILLDSTFKGTFQAEKMLLYWSKLVSVQPLVTTLQRTNTENWKQLFPEKELRSHSPNFHFQVSLSDLYIPTIDLPILLQEICGPILGI